MIVTIHTENPQPRLIRQAAKAVREGGIIVHPTDTAYGFGCDFKNKSAPHETDRTSHAEYERSDHGARDLSLGRKRWKLPDSAAVFQRCYSLAVSLCEVLPAASVFARG